MRNIIAVVFKPVFQCLFLTANRDINHLRCLYSIVVDNIPEIISGFCECGIIVVFSTLLIFKSFDVFDCTKYELNDIT